MRTAACRAAVEWVGWICKKCERARRAFRGLPCVTSQVQERRLRIRPAVLYIGLLAPCDLQIAMRRRAARRQSWMFGKMKAAQLRLTSLSFPAVMRTGTSMNFRVKSVVGTPLVGTAAHFGAALWVRQRTERIFGMVYVGSHLSLGKGDLP